MYVPSRLIDYDDAALTFQQITNHEWLFRLGIVGGLFCYGFFLFLPIVLYRLLVPVNENMARLMVLLAVISVPMFFINAQHEFTALSLIKSPAYLNVFSPEQIQSQVLFNRSVRRWHAAYPCIFRVLRCSRSVIWCLVCVSSQSLGAAFNAGLLRLFNQFPRPHINSRLCTTRHFLVHQLAGKPLEKLVPACGF